MSETGSVEFQPYRTPVLFVLVGENPLPNYVAARLLLKPGGRLYLVHSKGPGGTGQVASRLRTFLATDQSHLAECEVHLLPVDEYDAAQLRADLEPCLDGAQAQAMGLHYTGGTKFMAVHTHRAVEAFCQRRGRGLILSYLHADTMQLTIEPKPGFPGFCRSVVEAVWPSLEDVFRLHGVEVTNWCNKSEEGAHLRGRVGHDGRVTLMLRISVTGGPSCYAQGTKERNTGGDRVLPSTRRSCIPTALYSIG